MLVTKKSINLVTFFKLLNFLADVGRALATLKLPGVGCLSQSTICRFESLTLSHNNMLALKPILCSWLNAAEEGNILYIIIYLYAII